MVKIEKYPVELEPLGLTTLANVKQFQGDLVKNHKGRRDIFRVPVKIAGETNLLFLKRNWHPYKKDGIASFIKNGRVISLARQEWNNSRALEEAGFRPAPLVAVGEECSWLWEKFSFLITASAPGEPVNSFLRKCGDKTERRRVLDALALEIQRLHHAGFASPDLFARHIFVETKTQPPQFCYIDMARLDRVEKISNHMRARDLAALNTTAPHHFASAKERLRFLKIYQGDSNKCLFGLIRQRVEQLLTRKKYHRFYATE